MCFKNKEGSSKISPRITYNDMNRHCEDYRKINKEINENIREYNTKVNKDMIEVNKSMKVLRSQLTRSRTKTSWLKNKHRDIYMKLNIPQTQGLHYERRQKRDS